MRRLLACALLVAGGCYLMRSASVPIRAVHHPALAPPPSGLVVLLPGFGDGPSDYASHGFVDVLQAAEPSFEVFATDAHFAYYRDFSVVERLHEDIIVPARARGARRIWLVGISMGGLGASAYTMAHEALVEGVILLAPYLGDADVIEEVREAGGLVEWCPPSGWEEQEEGETRKTYALWKWFQDLSSDRDGDRTRLFIGYGDDDGMRSAHDLLARALPDGRTRTLPGGHGWRVWTPLFADLVERALGNAPQDRAAPSQ